MTRPSDVHALLAKGLRSLLLTLGAEPGGAEPGNAAPPPPARLGKREAVELTAEAQRIVKVDADKRLVTGWFSVCTKGGEPVVDLQGHIIPIGVAEAACHEFMLSSRRGNDMHQGEPDAVVVECMAWDKAKQDAYGVDFGVEGVCGTMKVLNDDAWAQVKAGERPMFSIGGLAWFEPDEEVS
jgi:hypothetical protein